MAESRSKPGYLLIELLAALTLAAIATAALLPSVVGRSDESLHRELVQRVIDTDRRARLAAIADGPIALRADTDGGLSLTNHSGETLARSRQSDAELYLLDSTGSPLTQVLFDRLGRGMTYQIAIRSHGQSTAVEFSGVSGVLTARSNPGGPSS